MHRLSDTIVSTKAIGGRYMLQKNIAQEEAIATIKGPVNVVSCPGSGKTTTLVRRIKNIIDHGVDPKKILMITFANSAAKDMQKRYVKLYGVNPGIWFMTIHSLCFSILKEELGYNSSSLISESQKMEFFVHHLKNNIFVTDAWDMARTIITEMSVVRNSYIPLKSYNPQGCDKDLFIKLYTAYENEKKNNGQIDFDDMLVKCEELLSTNKNVRDKWSSYFDYIQVDEYQDTNQIQKDIIYALIKRTGNLCVVGDDDQSIYGWRGADPSIMMSFSEDFLNAKQINMSTNYRSAQKIVDYANALIKKNSVRFEKDFISFRGEEKNINGQVEFLQSRTKLIEIATIIDKIKYLHEVEDFDYNQMAILFRTNKQAEIPVEQLSRANIPFSSTERIKSIYESYIFKDLKSYINLALGNINHHDLYSVLNHPNRYFKMKDFKDLPFDKQSYLNAIIYLKESKDTWRYPAAVKTITNWFDTFGLNCLTMETSPSELVDRFVSKNGINYLKYIKDIAQMKNADFEDEIETFNLLKEDAKRFATIEAWLKHASYMIKKTHEINRKRTNDGVRITTMHKSKGLEWKVVFVIGVDASIIPGKKITTKQGIEEERRVLYVAMTRAEDKLYISSTGTPSKFITELKESYKSLKDQTIRKRLPGAKVYHVTYGDGKVVKYTDNAIIVDFGNIGLKKMLFPEVFEQRICRYK